MVKKIISILFVSMIVLGLVFSPVYSQSVDDLQGQLDQKSQQIKDMQNTLDQIKLQIDSIKNSTDSLEQKLKLIDKELDSVNDYVKKYKQDLAKKEKELKTKESVVNLSKTQLNQISYLLYKSSRLGILDYFFLNSGGENIFRNLFYKQYLLSKYIQDFKNKRQEYAQLNTLANELNKEKKALEKQVKDLEDLKADVLDQKSQYEGLIVSKSSQSNSIKQQIGLLKNEISDLQVAILIAKSGAVTSVGTVPSSGDFDSTLAGFTQKAPSGSFEVFSFGAYTHRLGMSQYGAQARAQIGHQDYKTILKAYYGKNPVSRGTSGKIKVEGYGSMDFETKYLYGIAEMPSDWDLEALKAQAVAARTYAYNYYYNNQTICITQACQVWNEGKSNNPPTRWKQAVDSTKGMILSGVTTYYSATSGGYLTTSGWDTKDGKGGGVGWTTNAWESLANSPWFYKSWYRQTYSDSSPSCNRKPWMTQEEMSDILNTYLVIKGSGLSGSVNTSRILPITVNTCKISGLSGNPYSMSEMRNLLNSPVTSITGKPVVNDDSKGNTLSIQFVTNRGVVTLSGSDFKQVFNMRAPGYMSIPQDNYVFIDVLRK